MLSDRDIPVLLSVGVSIVVVADCVCTCPSSKLVWLSRDVASLTRPVYGDELSITGAPSVAASVYEENRSTRLYTVNVVSEIHAHTVTFKCKVALTHLNCVSGIPN